MHALSIQCFGTQMIEAAQQPGNVRPQRRGDLGSLMQTVHHDHRRPRAQTFVVGKAPRRVVDLRERLAERLGLRRETRAGPDLRRSVFGPERVECQVPAVNGASQSQ